MVVGIDDPDTRSNVPSLNHLPDESAAGKTGHDHVENADGIPSLEIFDRLIDEGELQHRMTEYYNIGLLRVLDRVADVVIEDVAILHLARDQPFIVFKPIC